MLPCCQLMEAVNRAMVMYGTYVSQNLSRGKPYHSLMELGVPAWPLAGKFCCDTPCSATPNPAIHLGVLSWGFSSACTLPLSKFCISDPTALEASSVKQGTYNPCEHVSKHDASACMIAYQQEAQGLSNNEGFLHFTGDSK